MLSARRFHLIAVVLICLVLGGCRLYTLKITMLGDGAGFVSSDPDGIQCGNDCTEQYAAGTVVKITAAPLSGSVLAGWSGGGCDNPGNLNPTQDTCTLTLIADTEVVVFFNSPTIKYTLTVIKQGDGNGVVSSTPAGIQCGSDCIEEYLSGTSVTLTAAPDPDSSFEGWSGGCTGQGACVVDITTDTQVTATFKRNYTLSVAKTNCGDGTVTSNPPGIDCGPDCSEVYPSGTAITLTATPDAESSFKEWSGACTGSGTCIINLAADTSVSAEFVKPDPLYADQWHLKNTGQGGGTPGEDINVEPVWQSGFYGTGVRIAVVDDGLEIAHEDLALNVVLGGSHDYVDGDTDPTREWHGTSVAGLAAARDGGECIGGKGVAPRASMVGYTAIAAGTVDAINDAMSRDHTINSISNNSWGSGENGVLAAAPEQWKTAINIGLNTGRGGRGLIYFFAAGNDAEGGHNSNYGGYSNYRGVMAVGAVNDQGTKSVYSEPGANLWISAPSENILNPCLSPHELTTTDRTGNLGMNDQTTAGISDYLETNYTKCFGGTSGAAPQVSGVAALMLEANPNLGWRDVRLILAETARLNDPTDSGWTMTTPPYHFNDYYGFGVVDATAAVNLAKSWVNVGPELTHEVGADPNLPIPDNDAVGVSDTLNIIGSGIDEIEWVDITFTANHQYDGDLRITLTSPAGAVSELAYRRICAGGCGDYNHWVFGSARHLGESADGEWTLTVKDLDATAVGTFQSWRLKFYGTGQAVPVQFPDPALEACVREHIDKPTGDIYPDDLVNLTGLSCSGGYWHPDPIVDLSGLEHCTSLQTLDLRENEISDLSPISGLITLKRLTLYANQISDIAALENLANLEQLYVAWNDITDVGPLAWHTKLQKLSLSFNPIGNIILLANLENLVEFWADEASLTAIDVVANFSKLEKLSLANNGFSSVPPNAISDLDPLANLSKLKWLNLHNNDITNINALSGLSEMTFLNLGGNSISNISALSGLTKITELTISDNSIADISPLANLTNLASLYAELNQIGNVIPLQGLVNLTLLNLNDNAITDVGALVSNPGLGDFDYVYLVNNLLNTNCDPLLGDVKDCLDIQALRTRGVTVYWDGP